MDTELVPPAFVAAKVKVNRRLKGVVADLTLDKAMLRDALGKKW